MLETKRTTSVEERQLDMRIAGAVVRHCKFLQNKLNRLEARLIAAEKEWAANPRQYKNLLLEEEIQAEKRESARYSVSEFGVKFALQGDGLDNWRRRFLGSQREKAIRAK